MSLRAKATKSAAYLLLRHGLGLLLGFATLLLVTRTIGPAAYGVYASALGLTNFVIQLTAFGVGLYLVRSPSLREEDYRVAFALYSLVGVALLGLSYPLGYALETYTGVEGLGLVTTALLLGVPIHLLGRVFLAKLERDLDFLPVATSELFGSLSTFVVAVLLAYGGSGYWAPTLGWLVGQGVMTLLYARYASIPFRPKWCSRRIRDIVSYGTSFTLSLWIWHLRQLVLPVVVTPLAGPQGAGYVALAMRLVETLAFFNSIAWRVSIALFARLGEDVVRLRRALEEGINLKVLVLGPFLLAFSLLSPWFVPYFLGEKWNAALLVYPYIAVAFLVNGVFSLHSSALYVLGQNWKVAIFHLAHVSILFFSSWFFVARFGFLGYGLAEMMAILSYFLIHTYLVRLLGPISYRQVLFSFLAFALALFWQILGWWAFVPLVLWLFMPGTWHILASYVTFMRKGGEHGEAPGEYHH